MSAEIIPFAEAAARVRRRCSDIAPADIFWVAAICCWPVGLAIFMTQAMIEASRARGGRQL